MFIYQPAARYPVQNMIEMLKPRPAELARDLGSGNVVISALLGRAVAELKKPHEIIEFVLAYETLLKSRGDEGMKVNPLKSAVMVIRNFLDENPVHSETENGKRWLSVLSTIGTYSELRRRG